MALDGSAPVALADATDGRGGTWSKDGTIVFAPTATSVLYRISASGGQPVQVTKLDAETGAVQAADKWFLRVEKGRVLFTFPQDCYLVGATRKLDRFLVMENEHLTNPAPLRAITAWPSRVAR